MRRVWLIVSVALAAGVFAGCQGPEEPFDTSPTEGMAPTRDARTIYVGEFRDDPAGRPGWAVRARERLIARLREDPDYVVVDTPAEAEFATAAGEVRVRPTRPEAPADAEGVEVVARYRILTPEGRLLLASNFTEAYTPPGQAWAEMDPEVARTLERMNERVIVLMRDEAPQPDPEPRP